MPRGSDADCAQNVSFWDEQSLYIYIYIFLFEWYRNRYRQEVKEEEEEEEVGGSS